MRKNGLKGLFWGILVILIGVLYLLFNFGVLPIEWKPVILSWQMLLIVIGITQFYYHHYSLGIATFLFGVFFLFPKFAPLVGLPYSAATFHNVFWPVVIIFVGLLMITHHNCHKCTHRQYMSGCHGSSMSHSHKDKGDGRIDYHLIMNGIDEIFLEPVFRGGEIQTVMGGIKLDLRKTTLPEGETTLEINAICGGADIIVPEDWHIEVVTDSFLGAFEDKRIGNGTYIDRKLVIKANMILGGGSIRC
ncbi:MAG: cell wall-active antibiotics response protein [Prevotella sp.]|jgi:predicted membrane protein|nr:cell wall-active antibiotics response protein [Prevotella sp.]